MGVLTSLNGVSTPGTAGTPKHLGQITAHHSMFVFTTLIPTACEVRLEGSHDSTHWRTMGSVSFSGDTQAGCTTSPNNFLVSDVRAYLVQLEGPPGIAVTVTIASAD